jgi:hypothetical protein
MNLYAGQIVYSRKFGDEYQYRIQALAINSNNTIKTVFVSSFFEITAFTYEEFLDNFELGGDE